MSVPTVTDIHSYRWSSADESDRFSVEDPATGDVIAVIQGGGAAQIEAAVEAAHRAFTTEYGLVAAIYTRDSERYLRVARRVDVGVVLVNNYFRGLLGLPFGGTKNTGYGREHTIETLSHFGYRKLIRIPSGIGTWPEWRAVAEIFE